MTRQEVDQVDGRLVQVICRKVWLSQAKYIECVLDCFNMKNAKSICTPLASRTKLSKKMRLKTKEEKDSMGEVPYYFAIGSLITHSLQHMTLLMQAVLSAGFLKIPEQNTGISQLDIPCTGEISQGTACVLKESILSSCDLFFIENDFPHLNLGFVVSLFYSRCHVRFYSCNIP